MKYIKTYEAKKKTLHEEWNETPKNIYWKVRTDTPYFEISLIKMGMTKDEQKEYLDPNFRKYFNKFKYLYFALCFEGIGSNYYHDVDNSIFHKNNYEYSGEIEKEITEEEIEEWKLQNDATKYNL
jgi:hypothetical protein